MLVTFAACSAAARRMLPSVVGEMLAVAVADAGEGPGHAATRAGSVALRNVRLLRYAALAAVPASLGSAWLFWHHDGAPYANVASRFAGLVAAVEGSAQKDGTAFRRFRFHDLRHRYAADFLGAGGNIYTLQAQLGHSSVKTTDIYLKYLSPAEARRAKFGGEQEANDPAAATA